MKAALDKPEQIIMFHALQLKYALKIQMQTGLGHSKGSLIKQVNKEYNENFKTAKQAFEFMGKKVEELKSAPVV